MPQGLIPITIQAPGFKGLNSEHSSLVLDAGYATRLDNAVFDSSGRVCSRKGHTELTTSDNADGSAIRVVHIFEHITGTATETTQSTVIFTGGDSLDGGVHKIWKYAGTGTPTDITGTITAATGSNWQFVNYVSDISFTIAEKIIGFQEGHAPIVSDEGAAFTDITAADGVVPSGNCGCSAFGRIWAVDAGRQIIKYSGLLNETLWDSGGAGSFDTSTYWPNGSDHVVAITSWQDKLVVFGQHNLLIYDSADDITNFPILEDTIAGVGCIARDSVKAVGSDVLFLSETGLRSLLKTLVTEKVPITDLSGTVRSDLVSTVAASDMDWCKSIYNRKEGMYLLIFGDTQTHYMFDVQNLETSRGQGESGQLRASRWTSTDIYSGDYSRGLDMYLGVQHIVSNPRLTSGNDGQLAKYDTYLDQADVYTLVYSSPWIDFGNEEQTGTWLKIFKKACVTIEGNDSYGVQLSMAYDFEDDSRSFLETVVANTDTAWEYEAEAGGATAEYHAEGTTGAEYGFAGTRIAKVKYNIAGDGQHFRVSLSIPINQYLLSIAKIDVYFKRGRISR